MSPTALLSYFKHIVNDVKNVENIEREFEPFKRSEKLKEILIFAN